MAEVSGYRLLLLLLWKIHSFIHLVIDIFLRNDYVGSLELEKHW